MGFIRCQCVVCRTLGEDPVFKKIPCDGPDDVSGGICPEHSQFALARIYRESQVSQGMFPCFGTSSGQCDQLKCKYREKCLSPSRPPADEINCFLDFMQNIPRHFLKSSSLM